jgi:type II secretory pathway pseudopilin PulG
MTHDNAKGTVTSRTNRICGAFTLAELLVILAVMAILALLLLPPFLAAGKVKAQRIACAGNLKNIGMAFRVFATTNEDNYPMAVDASKGGSSDAVGMDTPALVFRHFLSLSNVLSTPKVLVCPSDRRSTATVFSTNAPTTRGWSKVVPFASPRNVSYFVGLTANETEPQSLLSGDRNLLIYPGPGVINPHTNMSLSTVTRIGTNTTSASWSANDMHKGYGNVVLGDGSVQQYTSGRITSAINQSGDDKMALMFPGDEEKP